MRDILGFITYIFFQKNIELDTLLSEILKNHLTAKNLHVFILCLSGRNLVRKIEYSLDIV